MAGEGLRQRLGFFWEDLTVVRAGNGASKVILWLLAAYLLVTACLGWYWSRSPDQFDVKTHTADFAASQERDVVIGSATTAAAVRVAETLLDKPGGFLRNDKLPPGLLLDNMPNWEYGALIQLRDMVKAMREAFSRSQSQSTEDLDLSFAEPRFNFSTNSWIMPRTEGVYRDGIEYLYAYHARLADPASQRAQFYARADNLRYWIGMASQRMGSLSQRLSASVGGRRMNTDLSGDSAARQATVASAELSVKTPWLEIDDVFYEARGASWALIHFLKAIQVDFADVLEKKNAGASLEQIIRELEQTQDPVFSPIILNGNGFGLVANHSLAMASYISRANAALIDLRALLQQG
jgi:hypothetical protein